MRFSISPRPQIDSATDTQVALLGVMHISSYIELRYDHMTRRNWINSGSYLIPQHMYDFKNGYDIDLRKLKAILQIGSCLLGFRRSLPEELEANLLYFWKHELVSRSLPAAERALPALILDTPVLGLDDCLFGDGNSTQEYVDPGAHQESVHVAKARKMPGACRNVQRWVHLQRVS